MATEPHDFNLAFTLTLTRIISFARRACFLTRIEFEGVHFVGLKYKPGVAPSLTNELDFSRPTDFGADVG
jgi:hypothetical protein